MRWPERPLSEVADFCLGKMLDQQKNRGDLMPYLANINVRWGGFDFENLREMRFESNELERYGLKAGDIVMCEGGEPGRCAIWNEQVPGMMFQKALHRIRVHQCLDSRFAYYSLLRMGKNNELAGFFTGSTIKHLPKQKLALVKIEIPPLQIQRKTADVLSTYDDLIENNRRRITLLEQSARLLYREWFVQFRFPGHEHANFTDGLPEGWQRCVLGDVADVRKGRNITKETARPGEVPVVAGGLQPAYFHSTANAHGPVITVSASGANAGYVNLYMTDIWASDCSYLEANTEVWFLYLSLKERQLEITGLQKGAAQPHVYPRDLARLQLILPSKKVRDLFSETVEPNFRQIENLSLQNQKLAQARDLLLPRLMNGEIMV